MHRKDIALVLLVTVLWGLSFTVIQIGVAGMPPFLLCAMRFLFTAFPAVLFVKKPDVGWGLLAAFGICLGVIVFGFLFVGIKLGIGAGLSSIVMQAQVFFTILLSAFMFREPVHRRQILACLICFCGLALLGLDQSQPAALIPFLLVVAASFFWAVANILTKKAGNIDMLAFTVYGSLFSPVPLVALAWFVDGGDVIAAFFRDVTWGGIFAVAYLAYGATLLAFSLWARLLHQYRAAVITPFALLVPVSGMLCAMLFLGETITPAEMAGGALIFAGLIINIMGSRLRASPSTGNL